MLIMKPIIYALTFADGSRYIGSTTRPAERRQRHLRDMRLGRGVNAAVQERFDRLGAPTWAELAKPLRQHELHLLEAQCISTQYPELNRREPTPIILHMNTRRLTIQGRTQSTTEWAAERGLPVGRVYQRLSEGWTPEQALGFEETPHAARARAARECRQAEQAAKAQLKAERLAHKMSLERARAEAAAERARKRRPPPPPRVALPPVEWNPLADLDLLA